MSTRSNKKHNITCICQKVDDKYQEVEEETKNHNLTFARRWLLNVKKKKQKHNTTSLARRQMTTKCQQQEETQKHNTTYISQNVRWLLNVNKKKQKKQLTFARR